MSTVQEEEAPACRGGEREKEKGIILVLHFASALLIRQRSIKTSPSLIYRTTLIAVLLKESARMPTSIPSEFLKNSKTSENGLAATFQL